MAYFSSEWDDMAYVHFAWSVGVACVQVSSHGRTEREVNGRRHVNDA